MGVDDEEEGLCSELHPCVKFYWERYLPCRFHTKNVVLISLMFLCFALVSWTITATVEDPNEAAKANATQIFWVLDDTQTLDRFNLSTMSARMEEITRQKVAAARRSGFRGPARTHLRDIRDAADPDAEICKCICSEGVNESRIILGLQAELERKEEELRVAQERGKLMGAAIDVLVGSEAGAGDYDYEEEEEYDYADEGADELEDNFDA